MPAKIIYCQLEDDLRRVTNLLEDAGSDEIVLVFPKRSYLFGDSLNLRLLKKHTDLLGKRVSIITADERGQIYARDAGFSLRPAPVNGGLPANGDIRHAKHQTIPHITHTRRPLSTTTEPKIHGHTKLGLPRATAKSARTSKSAIPGIMPLLVVKDTIFPDVSGVTELLTNKRESGRARTRFFIYILFGLVVGSLVGSIIALPSAVVMIKPKTENLERTFEISLKAGSDSGASSEQLVLATQLIDRTLESSGKFTVEGKREIGSKARGKVKILNLSGQPLTLRSQTTNLTVGKKKYQLVSDQVAIPPISANAASEQTAGHEAEISATDAGIDSNLPIGTRLEITNQVFGSRPQLLFARSSSEVTGGNSRFVSLITPGDTVKLKERLSLKLLEELHAELKNKGIESPKLAARLEILDFKMDKPEGSETPSVNANIKVRVITISFESAKLLEILRQRLNRSITPGKRLQNPSQDTLEYSMQGLPDERGNGKLLAQYRSRLLRDLDNHEIMNILGDGSLQSASKRLESLDSLETAKVIISPTWWPAMPILQRRVEVRAQ